MATAISYRQVDSDAPALFFQCDYDYWREGNAMKYIIYVKMKIESSGGWRNNRWACKVKFNGSEVVSNGTVKGQTSGGIGTGWYTYTTGTLSANVNSGSIPIEITLADTGYSTSWKVNYSFGTHGGSLAVSAPSGSSIPGSISIPSSIAPDKVASISWSAASGGTNGVSGYQLAYSKNDGANWSYVDVSGTSYSLNLNSAGFVHGSKLKCAIQSYSTVNGTRYYSGWKYSGTTTTNFVSPSVPSSISIPSAIAPDKNADLSWGESSGGTNGVSGYQWEYSKDGGSNWTNGGSTTSRSSILNLTSAGFVHGSRLKARVRSYTIGQGANYYSGWKESGVTTTSFVAPSEPRNPLISTLMEEPIPTGRYDSNWVIPSNIGANGVSGYRIQWLKNGDSFGSEYDVSGTSSYKDVTEEVIQPNDIISFKVRAYTIGQNNRYYSGYVTSESIIIVSDKFIFISQNGEEFIKYKAFISVNGGTFNEIKKEKLEVI